MSNKEKLLLCPFCGGKGARKTEHRCVDMQFDTDHDYFWVECEECGARTKLIHIENARYRKTCEKELEQAKRKADKLWNKRVL